MNTNTLAKPQEETLRLYIVRGDPMAAHQNAKLLKRELTPEEHIQLIESCLEKDDLTGASWAACQFKDVPEKLRARIVAGLMQSGDANSTEEAEYLLSPDSLLD